MLVATKWYHVAQGTGQEGVIESIAALALLLVDQFDEVVVLEHIQHTEQAQRAQLGRKEASRAQSTANEDDCAEFLSDEGSYSQSVQASYDNQG